MSFRESLLERAAARRKRIVLCEGDDPRVRAAAERLRRRGDRRADRARRRAASGRPTIRACPRIAQFLRDRRPDRIVDGVHALDLAAVPVNFGAALVALGEADAAVAGAVCPTRDTIRAALWAIGTAPGVDLVSSAFYMVLPSDAVLTFTDCAVVPEPTPEQLAQIALAAARDRPRLVGDSPRVAFLSYSTKGSAEGPRVARVREAAARFRALAPEHRGRRRGPGATRRSSPTWPSARRRARRWAGGPTCWCSPISTRATSPTSWCSGSAAPRRSAPCSRAWRGRWPTCRAGPRPMILSRWPPWWRCSATEIDDMTERPMGFTRTRTRAGWRWCRWRGS